MASAIRSFEDESERVAAAVVELASVFAHRTGGMTADLWSNLPGSLSGLSPDSAITLCERAAEFLEFGGSVTLHFVAAGNSVLAKTPRLFDEWCEVLKKIAPHGNAVFIAFLRATPKFFGGLSAVTKHDLDTIERVLQLTSEIAETDAESALAAFRSSAAALRKVSLEQFEEWVETGLREKRDQSTKARRSYFALETRQSNEMLEDVGVGLHLEEVQSILRIYIEGLTGKEVEIAPLSAVPQEIADR